MIVYLDCLSYFSRQNANFRSCFPSLWFSRLEITSGPLLFYQYLHLTGNWRIPLARKCLLHICCFFSKYCNILTTKQGFGPKFVGQRNLLGKILRNYGFVRKLLPDENLCLANFPSDAFFYHNVFWLWTKSW